jgi:pyrroline-5-carboxylate reductase
MNKIGFIGTGNMGTAIIKGIAGSSVKDNTAIYAFDIDGAKLSALGEYGVKPCKNIAETVSLCNIIFLAVKPQMIEQILEEVKPAMTADKVIVSILAGINDTYIASKTVENAKVILVMPNTPLLLGEGASALSRSESVSDEEFETVLNIFKSCGKAEVISKDKMKEIIAINGSSPAFIYLFAKGFIDYAVKENIDEETAKNLFAQSLIGSAKMITDSGYTIDELIKMVSSPGGTTLAGLDRLYEGNLLKTVDNACESCTKRAYELSK